MSATALTARAGGGLRPQDLAALVLLGAIWGASFLFMRLAAPAFGALSLAFLRVTGASLLLLPLLALQRGGLADWRGHLGPLAAVGLLNSALPFALFAFAALHLPAGLSSILNATVPMWSALVAWLWLAQRPGAWRLLGLGVGFAGVVALVSARSGLRLDASLWAIAGCLVATLSYALAAVASKRWLGRMPPLAVAAGSQCTAALWLLPLGVWAWPETLPSASAWWQLAALALLCTGVAYLLFFRLLARTGPTQTVTVTFLIPVFALIWAAVFLGERLTWGMLGGGLVVLAGTALALGLWPRPRSGPP